jgi:AbrB family looped-hinge helix DNA binding protein
MENSPPISVKVSRRYQIAVPQQARKLLNIQAGDRLLVDVQDGLILLMPQPQNYTDHLAGLHKEIWGDEDGQSIVDREREEWKPSQGG